MLIRYVHYLLLLLLWGRMADIIYAMGPVNSGWPASLVVGLYKKKFVVKVVGDYAWEQSVQKYGFVDIYDFQKNTPHFGKIKSLWNKERQVVRRANKVIVPSNSLKEIVSGWGAKDVIVIDNSISISNFQPKEKPVNDKWIVTVGRLVLWKGMGALIDIMPDLLLKFPSVKLKIVGDGPELQKLKSKIESKELSNVVELVGVLPRSETLRYIAAADVFVLNSAYEGLSHTLLEAAMLGVNISASNIKANAGLPLSLGLFRYDDKEDMKRSISQFLSSPNSMKGNVDIIRERYSLVIMAKKTKHVLETL